jgi:hypothetical protein
MRGKKWAGVLASSMALAIATLPALASAAWTNTGHGSAAAGSASLGTPTAGAAGSATAASLALTWTSPTGLEPTGYTVLRSTVDGGPYTAVATPSTCAGTISATSCTDNGLSSNTDYYYVVKAGIGTNWSGPESSQFHGKTLNNVSTLAITSVNPSSNKATFGGTGGANGATITVYVCSTGTCSSGNNSLSATATVAGGTWTTTVLSSNVNDNTTRRAVAYQTTPNDTTVTSPAITWRCTGSGSGETCSTP